METEFLVDSTSKSEPTADATPTRRAVLKGSAIAGSAMILGSRTAKADDSLPILNRTRPCVSPLNAQAANDYCQSLTPFGGQLSNNIRELFLQAQRPDELHYSVLIVGSGYGASICAARISQALNPNHRIAILERGREWTPGSFPDTFANITKSTRQQMMGPGKGQVINPLGLFNLSFNDEINILSGSALGGTSTINANVALRPHPETFQRGWPAAIRDIETLTPYYDMAARQLSLSRTPLDMVPKIQKRRITAEILNSHPDNYDRSPVAVMYDHRYLDEQMRNQHGMIQRACTQCGNCITGCNVGAKNTLVYNYLPVAKWNGTDMFTQVQVDRIEKRDGFYTLHLTYVDDSDGKITRHPLSINSRVVILGAGSLGSSEILLNSQKDDFAFSPMLGKRWSANGDVVGFVMKTPDATNIGGISTCEPDCRWPVGSTVQSTLNFFDRPGIENKYIVQEAAIPRGVANLFSILLRDKYLDHSMVMLGMGHDEGRGEMIWKDGRYQICWPNLKNSEYRQMMFREFERIASVEGKKYKRLRAFGDNLVTVHPLGGCAMADTPDCGVVNDLGQVYDGQCGGDANVHGQTAVHQGLFVADGAVIPTALGANPYLTICAVSERIAAHFINNPNFADLFARS
jgi:cholesterol oxidase